MFAADPWEAMVDLHCHVLPGLDDGPADLAGSVAMLRAYAADGVGTVVATPHLRYDHPAVVPAELEGRCDALAASAATDGLDAELLLVPGGEVSLTWAIAASDADLRAVSLGGRGTDLLIETPPNPLSTGVERGLFTVALRGYRLTLAHPELSSAFRKRPHRLAELNDRGILLQVTGSALLRSPRQSRSATLAHALVAEGRCAAVASDAHSAGPWRPPELSLAAAAAARIADPARAQWLVEDAPAAILAGEPLPAPPEAPSTRRGRAWLRRRAGV